MKKVIITAVIAVLITGGIILAAMYKMGDRLIEEAIRSDVLLADNTGTASPEPEITEAGGGQAPQKDALETEAVQTPAPTAAEAPKADNTEKTKPTTAGTDKSAAEVTVRPEKKPVKNDAAVIKNEKIVEIKNDVSAEDKISAAALILKRLTTSDIDELRNMLPGGLSAEEKERAKQLAYSRFTASEIAQIKDMYRKYMK